MPGYGLFEQANYVNPELNQEDNTLINDISAVYFHDGSGIESLRRVHEKLIDDGYINEMSTQALKILN